MSLTYQFNLEKTVQAMAFFVDELGPLDKIKLVKLIYLADRHHFIHAGMPITGDRQVAMPYGPVPSSTLDAINGLVCGAEETVFRFLAVKNNAITLRKSPGRSALSEDELKTLAKILHQHGSKKSWPLARETERLPEYLNCYSDGTSTTIPYESIAKASGDKRRYRHDRVVLPAQALASANQSIGSGADI
jgi:Protein of unknown function (DUF4065)